MTKEQINEYTIRITQANTSALAVIAYELEIEFIKVALISYQENDLEEFSKFLKKANKAQSELINMQKVNNKTGAQVMSLYIFINKQIIDSLIKKEPINLKACLDVLLKLKTGFEAMAKTDFSESLMQNTHQVYSGLTYGKGFLNDSLDVMANVSRGYRA